MKLLAYWLRFGIGFGGSDLFRPLRCWRLDRSLCSLLENRSLCLQVQSGKESKTLRGELFFVRRLDSFASLTILNNISLVVGYYLFIIDYKAISLLGS